MCPSFFRIRLPVDEAIRRVVTWAQVSEIKRVPDVGGIEAHKLSLRASQDAYLGVAVLVAEIDEWTVFEEISGDFSGIAPKNWLRFAQQDDFLFLGYNDAIPTAELIAINQGKIVRDFYEDISDTKNNRDFGCFSRELAERFEIAFDSKPS